MRGDRAFFARAHLSRLGLLLTGVEDKAEICREYLLRPQVFSRWRAVRLMRTIKEEDVDISEYIDYNDAYRQLGRFLDEMYMYKRIHLYSRYARIGIRSEGFGAFP